MTTFRNAIEEISGLRYMADKLELASGLGRRVLYGMPFMVSAGEVAAELDRVGRMAGFRAGESKADAVSALMLKLGQVRDIHGTVVNLAAGRTLGDVEFFEVKVFAMTAEALRAIITEAGIGVVGIPELGGVVALLDPDGTGIPHFTVYDAYSPTLAGVRKKIRKLRQKAGDAADEEKLAGLYAENARLEDGVRVRLSGELAPFAAVLEDAMAAVAHLDILMAKAAQARGMGLCRPEVGEGGETAYAGLFNPALREALKEKGKDFQPVDVAIGESPTVITGANMGGKTVLLKTAALAQALCQFGFYVPAESARVAVVDEILTSIGDSQDEMSGLSSFAAEMVRLNGIAAAIKTGKKVIALIDEPARTTNPAEGEAIVNALLDFLAAHRVRALVTSHYGGIRADVKKLRVRGFVDDADTSGVTIRNIHDYMDYSLMEDDGKAPREALRIARMLGVDSELLDAAAEYLGVEC